MNTRCSISDHPLYLMDFDAENIMSYCDYLNTVIAPEFPISFTETHAKAAGLFKARFVCKIEFIDTDDNYQIFAKCKAEMTKSLIYDVSATISKTNEVKNTTCQCLGGRTGPADCKHALALLYAIQSYSQKELYSAPTEQLQRWHQAKPVKVAPKNFASELDESSAANDVNYEALNDLPFTAPIFDVITSSSFDVDRASYIKSVPLPVIVPTDISFSGYPAELSIDEFMFFHENINISFEEAIGVEKNTIQQNKSISWRNERMKRLTSTSFYDIIKCKSDLTNLAKNILNSHTKDISNLPAVKYGLTNEPLVQNVLKHKYPNFIFRKTGLVINPFFPYLGASPDGLLHNIDETFLIEIKCIYNLSNLNLFELVQTRKQFCLKFENDKFSLRKDHKFMYQIQGQLAISNLTKCLFVLMYKQTMPVYTEEIDFDIQLWLSMKSKLNNFYFKYYLPIIIN